MHEFRWLLRAGAALRLAGALGLIGLSAWLSLGLAASGANPFPAMWLLPAAVVWWHAVTWCVNTAARAVVALRWAQGRQTRPAAASAHAGADAPST